jgi:CRP/FNR family transcriptional regulator, nitrogen oxide reductase regulator
VRNWSGRLSRPEARLFELCRARGLGPVVYSKGRFACGVAQPKGTRPVTRSVCEGAMNLLGFPVDAMSSFLTGLEKIELDDVLANASRRHFAARTVVTEEGDPAKHFFLLISGRARYFFVSRTGRKVILHWVGPGEILGGMTLLSEPKSYMVSAETIKPASMLVWSRDSIRKLLGLYPKLLDNALSFISEYLLLYRIAHAGLVCDNARERVANVLGDLANCIGHPLRQGVELHVTNEELASTANVTPFTACRFLSEWQRKGFIAKKRGRIIVFSPSNFISQTANRELSNLLRNGVRDRKREIEGARVAS